jgi:hypothetical protein
MVGLGRMDANLGGSGIRWNYTAILNIIFLILAVGLLWQFFSAGGRAMLTMMGGRPTTQRTRTPL